MRTVKWKFKKKSLLKLCGLRGKVHSLYYGNKNLLNISMVENRNFRANFCGSHPCSLPPKSAHFIVYVEEVTNGLTQKRICSTGTAWKLEFPKNFWPKSLAPNFNKTYCNTVMGHMEKLAVTSRVPGLIVDHPSVFPILNLKNLTNESVAGSRSHMNGRTTGGTDIIFTWVVLFLTS